MYITIFITLDDGFKTKIQELKELAARIQPGIITVSKTHIKQDYNPPKIKDYDCIHENARNRANGGIDLYIHNSFEYTIQDISTTALETIAIKTGNIILIGGYRRLMPNFNTDDLDSIFKDRTLIFVDDLNAKNGLWGCETTDRAETELETYTHENGVHIYAPDEPNYIPFQVGHQPSTLDIVVSKNVPVRNIESLYGTSSDHVRTHMLTSEATKFGLWNQQRL